MTQYPISHLKTHNLCKYYKHRCVVDRISLSLKTGEVVGILGPNGAGKTTTFYMLVGITHSQGGQIKIDDLDITQFSIHQRAQAGLTYLPQETSIFRKLSVHDNIMAILQLQKSLSKSEQHQRCEALIDDFNLNHVKHAMGITLSGGERRRVEIARTMATNPKFILLDEPFAGIDPIAINDIKKMIHKVSQQGVGILITDHNVQDTLAICDRSLIVSQGQIIAEGSAEDIINNKNVQSVYLGQNFKLHQGKSQKKE